MVLQSGQFCWIHVFLCGIDERGVGGVLHNVNIVSYQKSFNCRVVADFPAHLCCVVLCSCMLDGSIRMMLYTCPGRRQASPKHRCHNCTVVKVNLGKPTEVARLLGIVKAQTSDGSNEEQSLISRDPCTSFAVSICTRLTFTNFDKCGVKSNQKSKALGYSHGKNIVSRSKFWVGSIINTS